MHLFDLNFIRYLFFQLLQLVADIFQVLALADADLLLQKHFESDRLRVNFLLLKKILQFTLHRTLFVHHSGVPVILDSVIAAAEQSVGDFGPVVLKGLVQDVQNPFLLLRPLVFLKKRIELVVPPLATLFSRAARHVNGYLLPLMRANV